MIPATALCAGAAIIMYSPDSGQLHDFRIQYTIFFAAACVFGYVATRRRHALYRDLKHAHDAMLEATVEAERARTDLQTLHGIIPICSHCHRVRIEDGRLWESVEMYVSRKTEAAFSHGVCPDCLVEHYPHIGNKGAGVS
jgi:hypothetical protein